MEELDAILRLIDAGGTIALLLLAVWLGFTGRVVPVSILEKLIPRLVEEILEELEQRGKL